jgi:VanZ family protein
MEQVDRSPKLPDDSATVAYAPVPALSLRNWMPALLWMALLFVLSTTVFSAGNTSRVIEPILRLIFPGASLVTVTLLHNLVRKAAHFTNYAILYWLLIRGPFAKRPYIAFACCVIYACLDEGHQVFVPGRGPSVYDVTLDSSGALFSRFLNAAIYDVR